MKQLKHMNSIKNDQKHDESIILRLENFLTEDTLFYSTYFANRLYKVSFIKQNLKRKKNEKDNFNSTSQRQFN